MRFKQRQKIIGIVTFLAFLSFFLPTYFAHALPDIVTPFNVFSIPGSTDVMTYIFQTVFNIIGNLMSIVTKALNLAVFVRPGSNLLIVEMTWKILRDFSNMIFIILLIYMAFATIFDHGKYRFQDMIVRFLIVAVLINFSLVIGNLVIDACQVLSNIFLGSIGNVGDRLGEYLNPSLLLPKVATANIISLVFAIILSLIFLFSVLVALVFTIIRVPIIWALLIVSPLAWMSHILPGTNKWWSMWWSQFRGWNLFLPVYLFFMYLGLLFLSKREQIIGAVIQAQTATGTNPANDPLLSSLGDSLSFNLIFFYIFAAVVMVGGTWAAKETTSLMGTGFDKGLGWARNTVGRITGYDTQRAAIQGAYGQRKEQFLREGFGGIYGGKEADERRQTRYAQMLGVKGAGKEFVAQVDKEANKLREEEKLGKIQINEDFKTAAAKESNTSARGLAMRSLLYERGMIDEKEFAKDMGSWTKSNPILAQSMAEKAKKGKYKSVAPTELLKMAMAEGQYSTFRNPESTVLRKGWFDFLKDNDKALGAMTLDQYTTAISLQGGPNTNDSAEYRKSIAKKRPDLVVDFDIKDKKLGSNPNIRYTLLAKELEKKKYTEIAEMSDKTWEDPSFVHAIEFNMELLDKSDPRIEKGTILANGKKLEKTHAGGGANFNASLRKAATRDRTKLRIMRTIRPGEFEGEVAFEEAERSADAIGREEDLKAEKAGDAHRNV